MELSHEAYTRVAVRAILLDKMRIFNERGEINYVRNFVYFPDENCTLRYWEEESKNMALCHAKENLPPEIFVKGVEIQWTEWGNTYPWERRKVLKNLTDEFNNQDAPFSINPFEPSYNLNDLYDFPEMDTSC